MVDKIVDMGKDIAKTIPFADTAIAAIEGLISVAWESYKDMIYE